MRLKTVLLDSLLRKWSRCVMVFYVDYDFDPQNMVMKMKTSTMYMMKVIQPVFDVIIGSNRVSILFNQFGRYWGLYKETWRRELFSRFDSCE